MDIALALGMAQTIVTEGLHDKEHLKEQSDMPLLVREDTGKFLRADEVAGLEANVDRPDEVFVMQEAEWCRCCPKCALGVLLEKHLIRSVDGSLKASHLNTTEGIPGVLSNQHW